MRPNFHHSKVGTRRVSPALALFERELAYYRADAPFLSVEKAAQRCLRLSALLAAVCVSSGNLDETAPPVVH